MQRKVDHVLRTKDFWEIIADEKTFWDAFLFNMDYDGDKLSKEGELGDPRYPKKKKVAELKV